MWHRLKPALALVLLAPLIAEYLLGSLSFSQLVFFPVMALMYGAGALVVREVTRRTGRGWPTIILLGLAYAVIEEGLATQTLFNPHYLGLHLIDRGFIPALGIGAPWTAYVVVLHVGWSICVPIAFTEALFAERRTAPWLRTPGLVVSGVLYFLGLALVAFGSWKKEQFMASGTQLSVVAVLATLLVVAAFAFVGRVSRSPATVKAAGLRPVSLGLLAAAAGSVFHLVTQLGGGRLPPWLAVVIALGIPGGVIAMVRHALRSGAWTDAHTDALMLGGLAAYGWLGFLLTVRLHGAASLPGQLFPFTIVAVLVWRLLSRPKENPGRETGA